MIERVSGGSLRPSWVQYGGYGLSTRTSSGLRSRSSRCSAPRLICSIRSVRPMMSSSERKPISARISRTSSAMKLIRLTTFSGVPVNFCAQRFVLRAHADRACVGMALSHHETAHGHQRRRADAELLRAQDGGDDDVAPGADAAVGAQAHAVAQIVEHQHLMRFGEPHLPGNAGVLDRGLRGSAGAADMTRDQDGVGARLGHAGRHRADARLRHQLHASRARSGLICFRS